MQVPRALVSGSTASIVSTVALGLCGSHDEGSVAGPINGPSQWLWGESEAYTRQLTWRHTATGYAIHHAMSILWAITYEQLQNRPTQRGDEPSMMKTCANAALVATLACAADYVIAPRRLRPGFRKHLSSRSIFLVYTSFGIGLALGSLLLKASHCRVGCVHDGEIRRHGTVVSRSSGPVSLTR
jgi:hypothetical protein